MAMAHVFQRVLEELDDGYDVSNSNRNKKVLIHEGYTYWKAKSYETKTYWECDKVDECGCKARIHTITAQE
uniref:FLYWCH-type domain-containing protein n=1 Tax=Ditylenchus dipsaci TaxID=166011 RepID=A0A915EPH1_9BILA